MTAGKKAEEEGQERMKSEATSVQLASPNGCCVLPTTPTAKIALEMKRRLNT